MDIRSARKNAGLTQEQLAQMIGVNRATLSKYEGGQIELSISMLRKICEALNCPLSDIMSTDEMSVMIHNVVASDMTKWQKKLESSRRKDAAIDRRLSAKIEADFKKKTEIFISSPVGRTIIETFFELNKYGQEEASERMIELTFLPQFSAEETPDEWKAYVSGYLSDRYAGKYEGEYDEESEELPTDLPETPTEGNTPTTQEKPPEGQTAPTDGK